MFDAKEMSEVRAMSDPELVKYFGGLLTVFAVIGVSPGRLVEDTRDELLRRLSLGTGALQKIEKLAQHIMTNIPDGIVGKGAVETAIDLLDAAYADRDDTATRGIIDIARERERQMSEEGWSIEHDDAHTDGSLARAAATYALGSSGPTNYALSHAWPTAWSAKWYKPTTPRRDLVIAGALILAEIERMDRAEEGQKADEQPASAPASAPSSSTEWEHLSKAFAELGESLTRLHKDVRQLLHNQKRRH